MIVPVGQREKKLRGTAFEDLVVDELEGIGCRIAKRFQGGETLDEEPDIYAYCNGGMKRIEVKLTQAWQKDGDRVRQGRFVLSPGMSFKECYAFGIDDQIDDVLSIDFVDAEDPDEYIRVHQGIRPKYPIDRLKGIRDNSRCFVGLGTIERPRYVLEKRVREMMGNETT